MTEDTSTHVGEDLRQIVNRVCISPDWVLFGGPLTQQQRAVIALTNPTDATIGFRVNTSDQQLLLASPADGILLAGQEINVLVDFGPLPVDLCPPAPDFLTFRFTTIPRDVLPIQPLESSDDCSRRVIRSAIVGVSYMLPPLVSRTHSPEKKEEGASAPESDDLTSSTLSDNSSVEGSDEVNDDKDGDEENAPIGSSECWVRRPLIEPRLTDGESGCTESDDERRGFEEYLRSVAAEVDSIMASAEEGEKNKQGDQECANSVRTTHNSVAKEEAGEGSETGEPPKQ